LYDALPISVSAQYQHSISTVSTQYQHSISTVSAQYQHSINTVSTQYQHSISTVSAQQEKHQQTRRSSYIMQPTRTCNAGSEKRALTVQTHDSGAIRFHRFEWACCSVWKYHFQTVRDDTKQSDWPLPGKIAPHLHKDRK